MDAKPKQDSDFKSMKEKQAEKKAEKHLDDAIEDSFPASDPISPANPTTTHKAVPVGTDESVNNSDRRQKP
jgi:hypothetical protein